MNNDQSSQEMNRLTPDEEYALHLNSEEREAVAKSLSVGTDTEEEAEHVQRIYELLIEDYEK